jgi:hypothetical protein
VPDFFIQFFVQDTGSKTENPGLTKEFRELFDGGKGGADFASKTSLHVHSVDSSHSVLMLDITPVDEFLRTRLNINNQIVMKVTANLTFPVKCGLQAASLGKGHATSTNRAKELGYREEFYDDVQDNHQEKQQTRQPKQQSK